MPLESARIDRASADRFLSLRRALGVTSFGINQMALQPGQRGRIHRHKRQEEVYLVLAGTLTVVTEDGEERFGVDELVRVPPEAKRQLANDGGEPVLLLALGGYGEHESRDGEAFASWDDEEPKAPRDVPLPDDLR